MAAAEAPATAVKPSPESRSEPAFDPDPVPQQSFREALDDDDNIEPAVSVMDDGDRPDESETLDVEHLAQKQEKKKSKRRRQWNGRQGKLSRALVANGTGGLPWLGAAAVLVAGFIFLREPIVRVVPDLASAYKLFNLDVNLRGLAFNRVQTFREMADGKQVLVVEGFIRNLVDKPNAVPAIRLAIRGQDAQEIYAWRVEPRNRSIQAGENLKFRTRVNAPPETAFDLQLRFVDRRSRTAGL